MKENVEGSEFLAYDENDRFGPENCHEWLT